MRFVNTSGVDKYLKLKGSMVRPYSTTPELSVLLDSVGKVVDACGALLPLLSKADRAVIDRLLELDEKGRAFVPPPVSSRETAFDRLRKEELVAQRAKVARVLGRAREESYIRSETRFASKSDRDAAGRKADVVSGKAKVEAKRIDKGGEIDYGKASLSEIMGHDRFIEENAGVSGIPMVVASSEPEKPTGWHFDGKGEGEGDGWDPNKGVPGAPSVPSATVSAEPKQDKPKAKKGKRK